MAEKIKAEDEPSIEEILDSIRQIISEDDKEPSNAPEDIVEEPLANSQPEAEMDEIDMLLADEAEALDTEAEEDVFELTDKIEPEAVFEPTEPEPEPEVSVAKTEEVPFVVDLIDESEDDVQEQVLESSVKSDMPAPTIAPKAEDSILTETAENAALQAITELARRTAVEHSGVTVEEIVRSELKPLLRGWLDKHLPSVIERLVREELERVSKRALED